MMLIFNFYMNVGSARFQKPLETTIKKITKKLNDSKLKIKN